MGGSISATSPTLPAQKDYHVFYLAKSSNCSESNLCKEVPKLQKLFDTETSPRLQATQLLGLYSYQGLSSPPFEIQGLSIELGVVCWLDLWAHICFVCWLGIWPFGEDRLPSM